jgi:hypothetical protein
MARHLTAQLHTPTHSLSPMRTFHHIRFLVGCIHEQRRLGVLVIIIFLGLRPVPQELILTAFRQLDFM